MRRKDFYHGGCTKYKKGVRFHNDARFSNSYTGNGLVTGPHENQVWWYKVGVKVGLFKNNREDGSRQSPPITRYVQSIKFLQEPIHASYA